MNSQEILDKVVDLLETLKEEHYKTSKAAHGRARKTSGEIKKLMAEYKKASTAEDKTK
jgi:hypothetical protein